MDEEVVVLFKKIGLAFLIALIFTIPTAIFVYNKFDNSTSDLLSKMNDKALIFVNGHKCSECKIIKKELKEYNVKYYEINKDFNHQNYSIIMKKIGLAEEFAPAPSLILVEKGKLSVNINEFGEIDLKEFFEEYELI